MSVTFECGDKNALVAYLYEECEPELRDLISGHLTRCASCSGEIDGLGWTRRRLQVWTPPMPELGFQMPLPAQEARVPWWQAPLPAWAQAVAAVVIFGVGLSAGLARGSIAAPQVSSNTPPAAVSPASDSTFSKELSQLEERLKSEIAQIRTPAPAPVRQAATSSDEEIMKKVDALLAQSEERQRREFTIRSVEMARDFEAQRRIDMASVREAVGQFQGVTGNEIRQQREAIDRINSLIRVSQQGR